MVSIVAGVGRRFDFHREKWIFSRRKFESILFLRERLKCLRPFSSRPFGLPWLAPLSTRCADAAGTSQPPAECRAPSGETRLGAVADLLPSPEFLHRLGEKKRKHVEKLVEELQKLDEFANPLAVVRNGEKHGVLLAHRKAPAIASGVLLLGHRLHLQSFVLLSEEVPQAMGDEDWEELLRAASVERRVAYLQYLVEDRERRERRESRRLAGGKARAGNWSDLKEEEKRREIQRYRNGCIVYRRGFHELLRDPTYDKKSVRHTQGARMWASMRGRVFPDFVIDMQAVKAMARVEQAMIGAQVGLALQENTSHRIPACLTLANFDRNDAACAWMMERCAVDLDSKYSPRKIEHNFTGQSLRQLYPDTKDVIYISPDAHRCLLGPLTARAYVILASANRNRETVDVCRRDGFSMMRLPIKENGLRWNVGDYALPVNNAIRILRDVALNGGDWKTAMLDNISRRHFVDEADRSYGSRFQGFLRRTKSVARTEIVNELKKTVWGRRQIP